MLLSKTIIDERYLVEGLLGEGGFSRVYRARDLKLGRSAAIKILKTERRASRLESFVRFNREIGILAGLRHEGLPEIFGSGEWEGNVYFASELLTGTSLEEALASQPQKSDCLEWGHGIAEALAFIHERGILHRDLKPGNVLLVQGEDGAPPRPKLIDFGLAQLHSPESSEMLVGTYGYMAPESIGVHRRRVDERSDLYSLGVLLYRALCGRLPFEGRTAGEVIHKQFTAAAPDPRTLSPDLPPVLAGLLLKLLAKDPEDRYQSARSLLADLSRVRRGDLEFVPGLEDRRGRVSFRTRLAGRKKEMEALLEARDKAQCGKGTMLLLGGEAGIGKSRLVEEFGRRLDSEGVLFLSAKCFELSNQQPLHPVRLLLAQFVQRLLQMDETRREGFVSRLRRSLGNLLPLANRLCPAFKELLGDPADLASLEGDRENRRFYSAIAALLLSLSGEEDLCVLHIDDLQWADAGTLLLLRELAGSISDSRILFLGGYRQFEIRPGSELSRLLDEDLGLVKLSVGPLEKDSCAELIEGVLGLRLGGGETLAAYLYQKQGGHPLTVLASLRELFDRGFIAWKEGEWHEDWEQIRAMSLPDSIVPLLLRRQEHLSPDEEKLLKTAALAGSEIDADLLLEILPFSEEKSLSAIDRAVRLQFLERRSDTGMVAFTHDRIRESFVSRCAPGERRKIHDLLATALEGSGRSDDPEVMFQLTHHLLEAGRDAGKNLLLAARFARERCVHDLSVRYYQFAILQLLESGPGLKTELVAAEKELVQVFQRIGKSEEAILLLSEMLAQGLSAEDQTWVLRQFGHSWFKKGSFAKSEEFLQAELLHLGERFPRTRGTLLLGIFLESTRHFFLQVPFARFLMRPLTFGPERRAALEIVDVYTSLGRMYYYSSVDRAIFTILRLVNITQTRLGPSRELGLALSGFGSLLMAVPFFEWALRYHRRGAAMRAEHGDLWGEGQSLQWEGYCHSWKGDYPNAKKVLQQSYETLKRVGDPWESAASLIELGNVHRLSGNYSEAFRCFQTGLSMTRNEAENFTQFTGRQSTVVALAETGDYEKVRALSDELLRDCREKKQDFVLCALQVHLGYVWSETGLQEKASEAFDEVMRLFESRSLPTDYIVGVYAYAAEAGMSALTDQPEARREKIREIGALVRQALRKTRAWPNNRGSALRAAGLWCALEGKRRKAAAYFEKSLASLETIGRKFELARTYYVYGKFLSEGGNASEGKRRLLQALHLFESLPNPVYVRRIQEILENKMPLATLSERRTESSHPDLERRLRAVIATARHLSAILNPDELFEKIISAVKELTHAQTGALLVYQQGEGTWRSRRWEKIVSDPPGAAMEWSEAIFSRLEEEKKPLLWDDASSDLEIGNQPSVMRRQLRSVLATPILLGEDLLGVLYLENNLLTAVFSPEDLDVLQAMAAQAAVSILNARYAQELQGRERQAVEENLKLKALLEPPLEVSGYGSLLGSSKPMREIFRKLERIRDLRVNVLLLGESGTGKGLCAYEIHRHSPLHEKPFVVIECSSIPENLLESELFGYEKGAFTGAMTSKKGKLELADGGTVFLDEIGELPLALQAKLLRFIQDKVLVRLGGTSEIRLDVRIIAATNKNLPDEVRAKRFREDLYYRINDFLVELPPLRDRGQDVVFLASEKLKVLQKELHKESIRGFSTDAVRFLLTQSWPGNIRQLQSILRSALIYTDGSEVTEKELSQVQEEDRLRNTLLSESQLRSHLSRLSPADVERIHLHGALEAAEHNVSLAAERLGLSRTTLTAKIKQYGLRSASKN